MRWLIASLTFTLLSSVTIERAPADVFNMGGTRHADGKWTGLASLETVPVGNPGNTGELSGAGAGSFGEDRVCGEVNYTYNIGKYEVTAGQYTEFLNKVAGVDTYGLYNTQMRATVRGCQIMRSGGGTLEDPYNYNVDPVFANRPVNYVSYGDAMRFANWLQNGQPTGAQGLATTEDGAYLVNGTTTVTALPAVTRKADWTWAVTSEDEWYKAAYYDPNKPDGAGYWDFPTKGNTAPGRDMADASGNNANWDPGSSGDPIDSGMFTTVVGEFQNSVSPYGAFDQAGNVMEWTESTIGSLRTLRGGAFYNSMPNGLLAAYRNGLGSATENNFAGFRVANVPEPSTFVLLGMGAIGLLGYAWRRRKRAAS